MTELFELTVAEAGRQIREKKVTPVDLMESLLSRAALLEPALGVWVTLDPETALAAAQRSQEELVTRGARGPLHGIPVGVKDIYYTEGTRTTSGSPIYADFVPTYDATTVALLKNAGAVIMGKTVTTEFACMDPPPTRNPWDPAHTPGGSSSGSAVGVASRMFPAALGSQTAGSVLRPASYNGVVGTKPTFGRISRYGVFAVAWSLDTVGFFTRTVEDAAILLTVLSGQDVNDSTSSDLPVPDYGKALGGQRSPPRIGLVSQLYRDKADTDVLENTERALHQLSEAGAPVEEVAVPTDFETLRAAHRLIMATEAATVHESDFSRRPGDYGPKMRMLVEGGMLAPAVAYVQAQRVRRRFRRDIERAIGGFDVLMTPSTPSHAPRDLSTTGDAVFQAPWTAGGFPAITIPSGVSGSGLPLGVQLIAASFAEEKLLSAARWCEEVLNVSPAPPV